MLHQYVIPSILQLLLQASILQGVHYLILLIDSLLILHGVMKEDSLIAYSSVLVGHDSLHLNLNLCRSSRSSY